jgi:RNA polymerase subunit RPABC4/transcription elongation factor Spt4
MELKECEVCGEVFPRSWDTCPTCGDPSGPPLKMRDND